MKTLNCEQASELLPLYAAGDLEGARAREVAAHVAACDGCSTLVAAYDEGRSLFAEACAPPEFGADFYAGVRSAVLAEIARDQSRPSTPSLIAALFSGRRLAYATTFALLLLACLVALQHLRRNTRAMPQEIARAQQDQSDPSRNEVIAVNTPSPPQRATTSINSQPGNGRRDDSGSRALFLKARRDAGLSRLETETRRDMPTTLGTMQHVRDEVAVVPRASLDPALVSAASVPSAVESASGESQSGPEVSRIEIQTADPNIRIIWLAPRKAEGPGPDHDNHENVDRN
ncbi:MAG: hypothetical protein QOE33_1485 [Acidobacteriota bacterium]|nr:hypothetical protein [Acidobacteriota bacterium]